MDLPIVLNGGCVPSRRKARDGADVKIGILGTGGMAAALGGAWTAAGHEVVIGGRNQVRAEQTAGRIGAAGYGSLADAAGHGDVILVAVPAVEAPQLVGGLAGCLAGRTVIDCTNPVVPTSDGLMLNTGGTTSVARQLAAAAPDAHVVKAFNLCHASIWTLCPPTFEDVPLAVPYCADHAEAGHRVGDPHQLDRLHAGAVRRAGAGGVPGGDSGAGDRAVVGGPAAAPRVPLPGRDAWLSLSSTADSGRRPVPGSGIRERPPHRAPRRTSAHAAVRASRSAAASFAARDDHDLRLEYSSTRGPNRPFRAAFIPALKGGALARS